MFFFILLIYFLPSSTCSELQSRQKRNQMIDSFKIEEANPGPFPYVLGKIEVERQYLVYFDLYGEGVDEEPKGVLSFDKKTGVIYVHKAVDYELNQTLKLSFEARQNEFTIDTRLRVEIQIRDINDNPPVFQRDVYEITVDEDFTQGSPLLTVLAHDKDKRETLNSTFHYSIKSVSPNSPNTEFNVNELGLISFKGCLDYEVADTFKVLVEAIDHGDKVNLSSSTTVLIHIQDGNNHRPVISGKTGSGKVNENESGTSPLRLHVTDKDLIYSKAWRAKYKIKNDNGGNFKIETDPDTNDGILTVVKPMSYEENATRELFICVENEVPYFFCEVKQKMTQGLWKVETSKNEKLPSDGGQTHFTKVVIQIEKANQAPEFKVTIKHITLEENVPIGTWVEKMTAVDSDSSSRKSFFYKIANDTSGWLKIDPNTGDITTVNTPDRETPQGVNSIYTVLVYAVDNGTPPMTGTSTLNMHIMDVNDNPPQLEVGFVDVCLSDSPTTTNISASDADGDPYGGPFKFELLGSAKEKWKLNPSYGFTAGLVKEPSIEAGFYTIDLKISDLQGESGVYSLNVTVCTCLGSRNCHFQTNLIFFGVAVVVAFLVLVLLLDLLLVAFIKCKNASAMPCKRKKFTSCKKKKFTSFPYEQGEKSIRVYNIENPGTDCEVAVTVAFLSNSQNLDDQDSLMKQNQYNLMVPDGGPVVFQSQSLHNHDSLNMQNQYESMGLQQTWSNSEHYKKNVTDMTNDSSSSSKSDDMETMTVLYCRNSVNPNALTALVQQRLLSLDDTETEMPDESHLYSVEGDANDLYNLDITFPDDYQESFQKVLENLGPSFRKLASICEPQQNHHKSL